MIPEWDDLELAGHEDHCRHDGEMAPASHYGFGPNSEYYNLQIFHVNDRKDTLVQITFYSPLALL